MHVISTQLPQFVLIGKDTSAEGRIQVEVEAAYYIPSVDGHQTVHILTTAFGSSEACHICLHYLTKWCLCVSVILTFVKV